MRKILFILLLVVLFMTVSSFSFKKKFKSLKNAVKKHVTNGKAKLKSAVNKAVKHVTNGKAKLKKMVNKAADLTKHFVRIQGPYLKRKFRDYQTKLKLAFNKNKDSVQYTTWDFVRTPFVDIHRAFHQDGFKISKQVNFKGLRGFFAEHTNATTWSNKKPKRSYYLEGTGYEMGYLMGLMAPKEIELMGTKFIASIPMGFLPSSIPEDNEIVKVIHATIMDALLLYAGEDFMMQYHRGVFPKSIVDEMRGIVDGATKAGAKDVTMDKMIALNYGFDALMSHLYTVSLGTLAGRIVSNMKLKISVKTKVLQFFKDYKKHFRVPIMCNAVGLRRSANKNPKNTFMLRDFMFSTGGVYHEASAVTIYAPSYKGSVEHAVTHAPGMVGAVTMMNVNKVSMGVNMLPGSKNDIHNIGINSLLLVRKVAYSAKSARDAIEIVANSKRGVTWLYPLCDINECFVLETGKSEKKEADPLSFPPRELLKYLPSRVELERACPAKSTWNKGVYVRAMNWKYPTQLLNYNARLVSLYVKSPFVASAWSKNAVMYPTEDSDKDVSAKLGNMYFPPQREDSDDFIAVSNIALNPRMRITAMEMASNFVEKQARSGSQWRYDNLVSGFSSGFGKWTMDSIKKWYLEDQIKQNSDKGTEKKVVGGSISIINLRTLKISTLSGYWKDQWYTITLGRYNKPSERFTPKSAPISTKKAAEHRDDHNDEEEKEIEEKEPKDRDDDDDEDEDKAESDSRGADEGDEDDDEQ